jgi:hypothetical protein
VEGLCDTIGKILDEDGKGETNNILMGHNGGEEQCGWK